MPSFENSKNMFKESKKYLASGVSSDLRLSIKPVPIFIEEAKGGRMTDVDGNHLIDYVMALGPQILGHSHPVIVEAIQEQVINGQVYGAQHQGEIELAKRIVKYLPCAEQVTFNNSGTEAVQVAIRLARAYTKRQKIIKFSGHYHGWVDTVTSPETNGQSRSTLSDIVTLPWNDISTLEDFVRLNFEDIAAIITEPIMGNCGCISPFPGYMEKMRELTSELGIVLIFDEVITGFRIGLGGAQESLGITPDLTTLGKAVAGGMPLSAVAGKKEIMDLISNGKVSHKGTHNGNPLSTAAGIATIDYLALNNGEAFHKMNDLADRFLENFEMLATQYSIPLVINRRGSLFNTIFTRLPKVTNFNDYINSDAKLFAKFAEILLNEGVLIKPTGLWFLSAGHTHKDIDETLEVVEKAFKVINKSNHFSQFV